MGASARRREEKRKGCRRHSKETAVWRGESEGGGGGLDEEAALSWEGMAAVQMEPPEFRRI